MRKLILGCLALLLTAAAPVPTGHVNDLANIIADDREAVIERSLRDYENQTTIEIAVVTTSSLDGQEIEDYSLELARAWGVGKKGADNGVLIVIAPNERKYRVEVGYGLEGDLTDASASILARESLVSAFRAGDYTGGIENLTQTIVDHLGTMTPEQRTAFRRQMEERQRREAEESQAKLLDFIGSSFIVVLVIAAAGSILFGIVAAVKRIKALARRIRRRKDLLADLALTQPVLQRLMEERTAIDLPNLPTWMQDDKEEIGGRFGSHLERFIELREEIEGLVKDDISSAEERKQELDQLIVDADGTLAELRAIPEQVRAVRHETEQAVQEVCVQIVALITWNASLTKKRYRVGDIVPALDSTRLTTEKENIESLLANRGEGPVDASEVVRDKATRLLAKVHSLRVILESSLETQSSSKRRIAALQKRIPTFPALFAEHQARLERLRRAAPRSRWAILEEDLPVFERTLSGIEPRLAVAIHANGMEAQLFTKAAETLTAAETALGIVDSSVKRAETLEFEVAGAERGYPTQFRGVQSAIKAATRAISDSNVGSGAKSRLSEAVRLLNSVQVNATLVDWIGVSELLRQALAKAKQAAELAQSDIDAAAREEQRRRDEEARRKRLARAAAAASAASAYSSSYGSGSSYSSGSSFSGFGGGGFGGGGASGGW